MLLGSIGNTTVAHAVDVLSVLKAEILTGYALQVPESEDLTASSMLPG